jgi:hypothetical protein
MAITQFANLDFEDIKSSITDYIRANTDFTDYDYEGSTLSLIIDMLAYNTYTASFNANMVSNEAFLDGATLRENVVSLARNIGYLPRPKTAARARVRFSVNTESFPNQPKSITLRKGSVLLATAPFAAQSFTFSIPESVTSPIVDDVATFNSLNVFEGVLVEKEFTVDTAEFDQRFILENSGIDYTTLRVRVKQSSLVNESTPYKLSESIFDIDGSSNVYFIQEIEDERYEIIFGDGIFGRKLDNGNVIQISYLVTNGDLGNRMSTFKFIGNLTTNNDQIVDRDISLVQTLVPSTGGSKIESTQSIKKYAGRIYAAQNRAVTSEDYSTIIRKIYPEAESLNSFGGEELDPPQFGRVFIAIKPRDGLFLSRSIKENIKRELRKYSIAGIVPEIIDTKLMYIEVSSVVYYNPNKATSADSVRNSVITNLNSFSLSEELNSYGSRFKFSKLTAMIDQSDAAITSNMTKIQIRRDLRTIVNRLAEYELCFGNSFKIESFEGGNIRSSSFAVSGLNFEVYLSDVPISDEEGEVVLIRRPSGSEIDTGELNIVRRSVGSVNYLTGEIKLFAINITSTALPQNIIQISSTPKSNDVIGLQDLYLQLDPTYSQIDMLIDNVESGADPTGSRFLFPEETRPIIRKIYPPLVQNV